MSTRAIVGYKRDDGTIVGAWCWNDGYDIENDLKRDFKSLFDVEFILEVGMFAQFTLRKNMKTILNGQKRKILIFQIRFSPLMENQLLCRINTI